MTNVAAKLFWDNIFFYILIEYLMLSEILYRAQGSRNVMSSLRDAGSPEANVFHIFPYILYILYLLKYFYWYIGCDKCLIVSPSPVVVTDPRTFKPPPSPNPTLPTWPWSVGTIRELFGPPGRNAGDPAPYPPPHLSAWPVLTRVPFMSRRQQPAKRQSSPSSRACGLPQFSMENTLFGKRV